MDRELSLSRASSHIGQKLRSFHMHQSTEIRTPAESFDVADLEVQAGRTRNILDFLPAIEWCLLAILAVAFVALTLIPGWRSLKSEFPNYYLAAELYHQGIPLDRVYEWTWFQRQNDHLQVRDGLVSFAPNPPSSILPLLPLTGLKPLAAKRMWMLFNLVLLGFSVWALRYATQLGWRRLILITLLSTLPLRIDFMFARFYVLILFLICTAYYALHRNRHWTAGTIWSVAAAMKLFPALSVILLIRRRNWRALAGFLVGGVTLAIVSVAMFGVEVHQVFFREVLTQASRGDWLGPYALFQNSFITLWSHLFLMEPELNPAPLVNSPVLYAVAMAATVTSLVFAFLMSTKDGKDGHIGALQWASLLPLLLLLSTYASADHSCILIFSAIVGFDALIATGKTRRAFIFLALYVIAAAPTPFRVALKFPHRLIAITALYALLLHSLWDARSTQRARRWAIVGLVSVMILAVYNYRLVHRTEDFAYRVPNGTNGYRFANPVPLANGIAFTSMESGKYSPVILKNDGKTHALQLAGDTLSVAGSASSNLLYSEQAGVKSLLFKLSTEQEGGSPVTIGEGQDPALSANGKWLAFIREAQGLRTAWLCSTDSAVAPKLVLPESYEPLDLTVTNDGDVIAAAGRVSDPHLLKIPHEGTEVVQILDSGRPMRYPSISPDGARLAFSRRERGSWHLFAHTFATGSEQQLTHAPCNAISPSWTDNRTLLYATDCGRGVGLSAIVRVVLPE
jgi:hypothetical protein